MSDLKEKARHATEECNMWKSVTAARQATMSVLAPIQMMQTAPQPSAQSAQMMMDPNYNEFMSMLAKMMSPAMMSPKSVERGFLRAQ